MNNNIKIAKIMSTDLVTVQPNDTLDKVHEIFEKNDFHHLPVIDEANKVVGILSKTDMNILCSSMTFFKNKSSEYKNERLFRSLLAKEVMKKQVVKLHPGEDASIAAKWFEKNLFHAIPIIDEEEKLVGILSTFDLIKFAYNSPVEAA